MHLGIHCNYMLIVSEFPKQAFLFYRPQTKFAKVVFTPVCHSVHKGGVQAQAQGGSAWEVSRPRPRGCPGPGLGEGGVSQHALRQTPPKQTVRILLECILVWF